MTEPKAWYDLAYFLSCFTLKGYGRKKSTLGDHLTAGLWVPIFSENLPGTGIMYHAIFLLDPQNFVISSGYRVV